MSIEALSPEIIQGAESLLLFSVAVLGYFSHRQREWIRTAWGNKCQGKNIGMKHKCGGDLQIHHITPQLYGYEYLGMTEQEVDNPYNAIPLCADAHVGERGTPDCIHPDQIGIKKLWSIYPGVFDELQKVRREKALQGIQYWNTRWDFNMQRLVKDRMDKYFRNGAKPFPDHNHKNGNGKIQQGNGKG